MLLFFGYPFFTVQQLCWMFFQSFILHHQVCFSSKFDVILFVYLVLYFDRIPLLGNFLITGSVGLIVGLGVMIFVKPRLKHSIEG
jgi:hypothetical protein